MVNVHILSFSHNTCPRRATSIVVGAKAPAYCKQHAPHGMMVVHSSRFSHGLCPTFPNLYIAGSKKVWFCRQYTGNNVVDVLNRTSLMNPTQDNPALKSSAPRTQHTARVTPTMA